MTSGSSPGDKHTYVLWYQYGPQTSTWLQVVTGTSDIIMAPGGIMDTISDTNMVSGGSMDHGHQHDIDLFIKTLLYFVVCGFDIVDL